MKCRFTRVAVFTALASLLAFGAAGCGSQPEGDADRGADTTVSKASNQADDHTQWWCAEHGVPEAECSLCSSQAATRCKAKGDWCEEHGRAASQCFLCDPARAEKFVALYEAKFGEKPPPRTD